METLSFFIILFVVTLGMSFTMIVLLRRQRRAEAADDTEAVHSITRLRMRLTIWTVIALVVILLIYLFAFGWYKQPGITLGDLSYSTLFNIIFWEFIAAQFVTLVCAYRGKMNASSRFADQAYLKRFSRKLLWVALAVADLTAAIFLLLKYT